MTKYICKTIVTLGICCMCAFISTIDPSICVIGMFFGFIITGFIWES